MKHCIKFEELISAYLDEELDSSDKLLLEEHLKECPSCLNLLALYHGMSVSLKESCIDAPSSLRDNVMGIIEESDMTGIVTPSYPNEIDTEFEAREKKRKLTRKVLTRYAPIAASVAIIATLVLPQFANIDRSLNEIAPAAAPAPETMPEMAYDDVEMAASAVDLEEFAEDVVAAEVAEDNFAPMTADYDHEAPFGIPLPEDAGEDQIEPRAPAGDTVELRPQGGAWTLNDSLLDPEYLATFYAFIMIEHEFVESNVLIAYYSDYYLIDREDLSRFIEEFDSYIVFQIRSNQEAQFALVQFVW